MTFSAMKLWAKVDKTTQQIHPLLFHMLDSANVAMALWQDAFSPGLQSQFSHWLNCDPENTAKIISFWVSLHDLGKASPAFQIKYPNIQPELESVGLGFPENLSPMPHGTVTAWGLETLLPGTGLAPKESKLIGRALAGHHGAWPTSTQLTDPGKNGNLGGRYSAAWDTARTWIFQTLRDLIAPNCLCHLPENDIERNAFIALFSGFVSTADWIASMENMFPYSDPNIPIESYNQQSAEQARKAVHQLGFCGWKSDNTPFDFQNVFNFSPTDLQKEVIIKASAVQQPAMLIIEAPTGCGKTEIAFSVADNWLQQSKGRGIYIAMPTTATSNQMFNRAKINYLSKRYPHSLINLQLVHGSALLSDDFQSMVLQSVGEEIDSGIAAMGWFLPRKRTLLASFGIGTVDQALLSILKTRHFFVRLFGLGGKIIIFDEVHAYDVYMSSLFSRLLEWLHAAGVSVILLSATLPVHTRAQLVKAYSGEQYDTINIGYPCFTIVENQKVIFQKLPSNVKPPIKIHWSDPSPEDISNLLRENLTNGGCAAVICNTVRRAQEVYQTILSAKICPEEDCLLFHARFPYQRRLEIENEVLNRFGKQPNPKRPYCSILVATQVIEQSLDLDFDLMVSDLAPIDLLIQRCGRLQRHNRTDRPTNLTSPILFLCNPSMEDQDAPNFGSSRFVYEPYLLIRTLALLQEQPCLELPEKTPDLIESVYGEKEIPGLNKYQIILQNAKEKMADNEMIAQRAAKNRVILPPSDPGVIQMENDNLEDENPTIHTSLQALTRLGSPGVQLVCLHRLPDGTLNTHPAGDGEPICLDKVINHHTIQSLLRASLNVQNFDVVKYFQSKQPPTAWKDKSALRFHYLVEFSNGIFQPEGANFRLILDHKTGLSVEKEVQ